MYKVLKKYVFLVLFAFFSFESFVLADEIICNYEDIIQIKYNSESPGTFTVSGALPGFDDQDGLIVKRELGVDQPLKSDYDNILTSLENGACPEFITECTYSQFSINAVTLKSMFTLNNPIGFVVSLIMGNPGAGYTLTTDKTYLLVFTESGYENSEYKKYEGNGQWNIFNYRTKKMELYDTNEISGTQGALVVLLGLVESAADSYQIDDPTNPVIEKTQVSGCQSLRDISTNPKINANCPALELYLDKYTAFISEYKNCSSASCSSNYRKKIEDTEIAIKDVCKVLLGGLNYGGEQFECMKTCIGLQSLFNSEKEGTDLHITGKEYSECGLPMQIVLWILNIIKWVKYIVPALVVLLGMIDFIRAIATDKDDGMKQAQGRFIKRLIAAALIFIVPLILTFILEKMGFTVDTCGISF